MFIDYVVNCFHFCIFDVLRTVKSKYSSSFARLWIAFIFVSLTYWGQSPMLLLQAPPCCELLSFLYLWRIEDSCYEVSLSAVAVVNCFHFCIFDVLRTVTEIHQQIYNMLWIAFIFVSLTYWGQLCSCSLVAHRCCELLSFLYLWRIEDSNPDKIISYSNVVNCFHFCIFDVLRTVFLHTLSQDDVLWIAFIFVSLTYWGQWQAGYIYE